MTSTHDDRTRRRRFWGVTATFRLCDGHSVMKFGIEAPDYETALALARQRIEPRDPVTLDVKEVPQPRNRLI